jgi:hypothetical protein
VTNGRDFVGAGDERAWGSDCEGSHEAGDIVGDANHVGVLCVVVIDAAVVVVVEVVEVVEVAVGDSRKWL